MSADNETHTFEHLVEDYSRTQVPEEETRGWFQLSIIFLGISIAIPSFLLGSALTVGMGLKGAILAILWGTVIATPICILAAHVGAKSRLSTAMTLRFAFGITGAKLISAIIAVDMFCWFAVNTEIFGSSIRETAAMISSVSLQEWVLCIAAGLLMTAVTIFGYHSVEKLSLFSVPLLVAVVFAYVIWVGSRVSVGQTWSQPIAEPISMATGISIVAGTYLSVSVLLPDFTRYARKAKHSATAVILGFTVGLPPFVLIGAFLTAATREEDFVRVMLGHGWGLAAIAVIALTCWVHMNDTLYSASLNLAAIVQRYAKWKLTVFAGMAGTAVALMGIVDQYVPFLIVLSVVLPPIAAVYIADYLYRRKHYLAGDPDALTTFQPDALLSWAAGVLSGFLTAPVGKMGFGLFNLTYFPAIDAFLVSFFLLLLLKRIANEEESSHVVRAPKREGL